MRQREIDLRELQDARAELAAAWALFNEAVAPEDVDRAIGFIMAAEARVRKLCRVRDEQRVA